MQDCFDADEDADSFFGRGWTNDDTLSLTSRLGPLVDRMNLERDQVLSSVFRCSQSTVDFSAKNQGDLDANTGPMRSLFARFFPANSKDAELQEIRKLIASE